MKQFLVMICGLVAVNGFAGDNIRLFGMLAVAATNQSAAYLQARADILALGTSALPALGRGAVDTELSWQQRLVARICYERIVRNKEIQTLREHDWRSYPPYLSREQQMVWEATHTNEPHRNELNKSKYKPVNWTAAGEMRDFVLPRLKESALWYYEIELTWKITQECAVFKQKPDQRFNYLWPRWCRETVKNQPEGAYMLPVMFERLQNDTTLDNRENVEFYKELLENKQAAAVPVLVERYDAYNRREVIGPELFAGRHDELYLGMFEPIVSFADSRHADLLEKFITEKPALAPLKKRLEEVRARPVPPPEAEPPFRIGTNPVVVVP